MISAGSQRWACTGPGRLHVLMKTHRLNAGGRWHQRAHVSRHEVDHIDRAAHRRSTSGRQEANFTLRRSEFASG